MATQKKTTAKKKQAASPLSRVKQVLEAEMKALNSKRPKALVTKAAALSKQIEKLYDEIYKLEEQLFPIERELNSTNSKEYSDLDYLRNELEVLEEDRLW